MKETQGQLTFEWAHFMKKLKIRQPALYRKLKSIAAPNHHPIFKIVPGPAKEPVFKKASSFSRDLRHGKLLQECGPHRPLSGEKRGLI